ncbi:MAG: hypothetical protein V4642_11350 [Bacteroidota bacterium]
MERVKPTEPDVPAVQQPFYKTWWFLALIAAAVMGILIWKSVGMAD